MVELGLGRFGRFAGQWVDGGGDALFAGGFRHGDCVQVHECQLVQCVVVAVC